MKTILAFVLAAILLPGQGFDPVRVPFLRTQTGLVRAGLVGGWDLRTVNLLKWSEDFSNAAWPSFGVTGVANAVTDPFGGTRATRLRFLGQAAVYQASTYSNLTVTISAWVRVTSGTGVIRLFQEGAGGGYITHTATTEWTRFASTYTIVGSLGSCGLYQFNGDNPGTDVTIEIYGIQLNVGPTALPYVRTTDQQRIPALNSVVTTTNLARWSEDVTQGSVWTKGAATTLTANYGVAPDGSSTANRFTTPTGGTTYVMNASTIVVGKVYTWSVYVKDNSGSNVNFDMTQVGVGAAVYGTSDAMTPTSTWTLFSYTFTAVTNVAGVGLDNVGNTNAVDILFWHPQLVEGAVALPYIKTDAETREPGWPFLQLGSTSGVDSNDPVRGATGLVFDGVDDHATSSTIYVVQPSTHVVVSSKADAATPVVLTDSGAIGPRQSLDSNNGVHNMFSAGPLYGVTDFPAYAWVHQVGVFSGANSKLYVNGLLDKIGGVGTDALNGLRLGAYSGGGYNLNGIISFVLIYNRALTPKEVRQNHQWMKAQMAQVGVTLP